MSLSMVISTTTSFNFVTPFTNFEGQKFVLQDRTRTVESYLQQMANPTYPKYLPILRAPLKSREGKPYH